MTVLLRIIEPPENLWSAKAGEMWACAQDSHAIEGRPPCFVIRLPGGAAWWHTNWKSTSPQEFWTVTGEAPNLTVKPSINVGPEIWHGWITDGTLVPDTDSQGKP